MNEQDKQLQQLQQQLVALNQNLRAIRHAINNNVAVIMAMAEISQRNPAQTAKLCQLCLEKAPQIATTMAAFSEAFEGVINFESVENPAYTHSA